MARTKDEHNAETLETTVLDLAHLNVEKKGGKHLICCPYAFRKSAATHNIRDILAQI